MKLSYQFFKDYPVTRMLVGKIMGASYQDMKTTYKIKKMVDALGAEFDVFKDLLEKKEDIIQWEDKKVVNTEEVKEAFAEFYAHEFEIDFPLLTKEEIERVKEVTPREIELLKMISEPNAFESLLG